jgi:hypothetical protein
MCPGDGAAPLRQDRHDRDQAAATGAQRATLFKDCRGVLSLLFCIDLSVTHRSLDSGELRCPRHGCDGRLGPWGSARPPDD